MAMIQRHVAHGTWEMGDCVTWTSTNAVRPDHLGDYVIRVFEIRPSLIAK